MVQLLITPLLLGHATLAAVTRIVTWLPTIKAGVSPILMLWWPFSSCHGVGLCFATYVMRPREAMSNWVTSLVLLLGLAG